MDGKKKRGFIDVSKSDPRSVKRLTKGQSLKRESLTL